MGDFYFQFTSLYIWQVHINFQNILKLEADLISGLWIVHLLNQMTLYKI